MYGEKISRPCQKPGRLLGFIDSASLVILDRCRGAPAIQGAIHLEQTFAHTAAIEAGNSGLSGGLAEAAAQLGVLNESLHGSGQSVGVAGGYAQRIDPIGKQFYGPACSADDDGTTARHRFRHRASKRFGMHTSVYHDIETTINRCRFVLKRYQMAPSC